MRPDDLLELLRQRPFLPFRIHVTDGTVYEVRHPDQVLVERTKIQVFVPSPAHATASVEEQDAVALLHITRLSTWRPAIAS